MEPGLACGSDTAHMSILGYDPMKHYRGRGAFESLGAGVAVKEKRPCQSCSRRVGGVRSAARSLRVSSWIMGGSFERRI